MKGVIDGVVLAGGRSRRMNGIDKALIHHRGKALFEYAAENLLPHVRRVLINRSSECQTNFSQALESLLPFSRRYDVILDQRFVGDGPLSGILNTFEQTDADYLMIASCDQLPLPYEVYATQLTVASAQSGAYAFDGQHIVPTCAVLPRGALLALETTLQQGERRLTQFMQQHAKKVHFEHTEFANINSLAQLDV